LTLGVIKKSLVDDEAFLIFVEFLHTFCPGFEGFVVAGAADEFLGLGVVEEWNAAATTLVVLFEEFGVVFVVPGFEVLDFDVFFFFELFYYWVHFVTVSAFGSAEHEEVVVYWGTHRCES